MRIACCFLALVIATSPAHAQRRRPATPPPTLRKNPLDILSRPNVQKDLKLTEEQVKKVTEATEKYRAEWLELQKAARQNPGQEETAKKQVKLLDDSEMAAARILDKAQTTRFKQIQRQTLGPRAFANPDIAAELRLTKEQLQQIQDIQQESQREISKLTRKGMTKQQRDEVSRLGKERNERILKLLTAEQVAKWKEMTGPPLAEQAR